MSIKVMVIPPVGQVYTTDIAQNLPSLQKLVGGYIEAVILRGATLYLNEEGKILGLPLNEQATFFARTMGWLALDVLCGTVVVCGPPDDKGENTSLPATVEEMFLNKDTVHVPLGQE
jgi:hypothetical protein